MASKLGYLIAEARQAHGWTQMDLAKAVGVSQPSITAIEAGKTLKPGKWREIADTLGIPRTLIEIAMADDDANAVGIAFRSRTNYDPALDEPLAPYRVIEESLTPSPFSSPNAQIGERLDPVPGEQIPVYGRAQGGPDGKFEFNGEVMGWEPRPPKLQGVRGVYAVYIDGESMYPRYKPGETVVAHPGRPIARGDDVVVQVAPDEEGEAPLGYVKELVSFNSKELVVKQFNPSIEIRFPRERVISVHRIVSADR